jgi:hypothetical protein
VLERLDEEQRRDDGTEIHQQGSDPDGRSPSSQLGVFVPAVLLSAPRSTGKGVEDSPRPVSNDDGLAPVPRSLVSPAGHHADPQAQSG